MKLGKRRDRGGERNGRRVENEEILPPIG